MTNTVFAAHDGNTIWGVGATPDEALSDATNYRSSGDPLQTDRITPALAAQIEARGGDIAFHRMDSREFGRHGLLGCEADVEAEDARYDRIDEIINAHPMSAATWGWTLDRSMMHRRMAAAFLDGNAAVTLSARRILQWTSAAPTRHDTAPGDPRPCRLSHDERCAAQEMADNLGCLEFSEQLRRADDDAIHARRNALRHTGEALFGVEWVSPLGRALDVATRTIQRWAAGENAVPRGVVDVDLPAVVARLAPAEIVRLEARLAALRALISRPEIGAARP